MTEDADHSLSCVSFNRVELELDDGRVLAYEILGHPDGFPVILLHGTPGSSRQVASLAGPAFGHRIAMITPDRAGYGGSSYDPSRTISSSARDVGALIRHLRLGPCSVVGLSGGGPTALACGVLLTGQIEVVATVGGVAPLVPQNPSLPPDRLVTRVARFSQTGVRLLFEAMVRTGRAHPEKALDRFADMLAPPDALLLRDNAVVRRAFLDDLAHASPTTAKAAARDFWLFAYRWDVDLRKTTVPVHIWHGTDDRNVPVEHAHVIASLCPNAQLHIVDGGGHMLLSQLDRVIAGITPSES